jgi:hypothetical protein
VPLRRVALAPARCRGLRGDGLARKRVKALAAVSGCSVADLSAADEVTVEGAARSNVRSVAQR